MKKKTRNEVLSLIPEGNDFLFKWKRGKLTEFFR